MTGIVPKRARRLQQTRGGIACCAWGRQTAWAVPSGHCARLRTPSTARLPDCRSIRRKAFLLFTAKPPEGPIFCRNEKLAYRKITTSCRIFRRIGRKTGIPPTPNEARLKAARPASRDESALEVHRRATNYDKDAPFWQPLAVIPVKAATALRQRRLVLAASGRKAGRFAALYTPWGYTDTTPKGVPTRTMSGKARQQAAASHARCA